MTFGIFYVVRLENERCKTNSKIYVYIIKDLTILSCYICWLYTDSGWAFLQVNMCHQDADGSHQTKKRQTSSRISFHIRYINPLLGLYKHIQWRIDVKNKKRKAYQNVGLLGKCILPRRPFVSFSDNHRRDLGLLKKVFFPFHQVTNDRGSSGWNFGLEWQVAAPSTEKEKFFLSFCFH